jgi:hypothetical protein
LYESRGSDVVSGVQMREVFGKLAAACRWVASGCVDRQLLAWQQYLAAGVT